MILLDNDCRVWMLRINDPIRPRWILPGGGVEEGEIWEEAARRELWEECAINDAVIGPLVATREALQQGLKAAYLARERYFLARINGQQPAISNMYEYESADYTQQRWFSANEIRASHEGVYPLGLADLLDTLERGKIPSEPWVWPD